MVQDFINARPKYIRDSIPKMGAKSGPETRSHSTGKSRQSCVKARDPQNDARWVKMAWFQRNPRVITHGQILVQMAAKWTEMFMGCSTLARERPQHFSFSALTTVVFCDLRDSSRFSRCDRDFCMVSTIFHCFNSFVHFYDCCRCA